MAWKARPTGCLAWLLAYILLFPILFGLNDGWLEQFHSLNGRERPRAPVPVRHLKIKNQKLQNPT